MKARFTKYFNVKDNKKIYWYLANSKTAHYGLNRISKIFGKMNHIIFEVYNEPCPGDKDIEKFGLSALPSGKWRRIEKDLIATVKKNSDNFNCCKSQLLNI